MRMGLFPVALHAADPYSIRETVVMISAAGHRWEVRNPALGFISIFCANSSQKKMLMIELAMCAGQLIEKNTVMTEMGSHHTPNGSRRNGILTERNERIRTVN